MSIFIQKAAPSRLPRILRVLSLFAATLAILAARAAADDEARIVAEAKRIHENVLVLDSHLDIPVDYGIGKLDPGLDGRDNRGGLIGTAGHHRRVKNARRNGTNPNAKAREVPAHNERQSNHASLRSGICSLARWA